MTKVKGLLNLRINGHSKHILSVPWRDLSREKRSLRFAVFERIWYPFELLGVSVQKKLSSVRTTWAIHLKKVVIRSNDSGHPFEKVVIRSNSLGYTFEKSCHRSNSLGCPFEKIVIRSNSSGYPDPFGKEFVDRSSD